MCETENSYSSSKTLILNSSTMIGIIIYHADKSITRVIREVNNIERNTALKVYIFVKAFKCSIMNGGETFGNTPWKSHQPCTEDGAVITYVDTRHKHIVNEIW